MAQDELGSTDALVQLSFLVQGTLERRAAERGFSLSQTRLLGVLRGREPTMGQLARLLGLDKSSVSGLVDRAQRRGLVTRRPSQGDRRSAQVVMTPAGAAVVDGVAARVEADLTGLLGGIGETEQATLITLISRMLVSHAAARDVDLFA